MLISLPKIVVGNVCIRVYLFLTVLFLTYHSCMFLGFPFYFVSDHTPFSEKFLHEL